MKALLYLLQLDYKVTLEKFSDLGDVYVLTLDKNGFRTVQHVECCMLIEEKVMGIYFEALDKEHFERRTSEGGFI